MPLDKDLYRKAYALYRQWNEAELVARARNASQLSPDEAWRRYVDLVEFSWRLCPEQSQWQWEQKLQHLDRYHAKLQKLEEWRRARGKTA